MARTMVEHQCESCGKPRLVSPDKIRKGLQRYCRQCQGPVAAAKRRAAMLKRGGPRAVTYDVCRECSKMYETAALNDSGYCGEKCLSEAQSRGYSFHNVKKHLNQLWPGKIKPSKSNAESPLVKREHWVQQNLI